ncbi:MAG TPA: TAT-variant-translocated molybdopterin oxidoreductase [Terriglobales bacterium]|nr:TAT-variant-translocated molybdopterin oxidoreductase [Terriglobales bacterium]
MSKQDKNYWKALAEKEGGPEFLKTAAAELGQNGPRQFRRRDFLKAAGFTVGVAVATGCSRAPIQKAIPLLSQPEEIVPGRSLFYASTCAGCSAGCGLVAKVRDGRPIKLEGNPEHPLSRGGLCATGQASILGLYDSQRIEHPLKRGNKTNWETADQEILEQLASIRSQHGSVRFLTGTITSPSVLAALQEFLKSSPDSRHVIYDPLSNSTLLDAYEQTHGQRILPRFHFEQAEVIVSFDADFLGTWISPVEYTVAYRAGRNLVERRVSYHVQFEPRMSVTGSKADQRFAVAPGDLGVLLTNLTKLVANRAGVSLNWPEPDASAVPIAFLEQLADRLWNARRRSLVVCGSQDVHEHVLVNYLNHLLDSFGTTIDLDRPSQQVRGDDREFGRLFEELRAGKVQALFVYGVNPAFDLPGGDELAGALRKVPLLVSLSQRSDETAELATYVLPERHFLEAWGDVEAISGLASISQPTMHPRGDTRSLLETLSAWTQKTPGKSQPAYDLLREFWRTHIFPRQKKQSNFDAFWDQSVHDGFADIESAGTIKLKPFDVRGVQPVLRSSGDASSFSLVLYPTVAMLDGRSAYNPWLHELPDPISKVTWDNYASLSPGTARLLGVGNGDVVRLTAAGKHNQFLELPVFIQPGQHDQVVAVALGFGSRLSSRFAKIGPQWIDALLSVGENGLVGQNAAPFIQLRDGALRYSATVVTISRTGKQRELACTQIHNTLTVPAKLTPPGSGPRPIIQETTLAAFLKDPHSGVEGEKEKEDLWPTDHPYTGPRWGMVVDLNACTGCSSCVIACQVENNIPVVGRDEVRRNREMHWLRIDRYYTDSDKEQVDVAHQPLMCQQCENAPCETVCPVLATVHSEDGLNQQVYNRCVGTRYCANNCPYKGRRFNWFNYAHDDQLQNLVLNPDVAVRSRGVMEKCTFCVQRIQEAKIAAKTRGERIEDGAIQTACQQSCPAQAIYFGDLNDPTSRVSKMMANPRRYRVLEELNVGPSVGYLTVVRNREQENPKEEHHG